MSSASVSAGYECPAGPDVGPHGSSPNQQNALFMAPALFLGLPSCSVGSHRFAVALDADLLAANSFLRSFGSGRDRTVVVIAPFGRERIDDPRQLVGERHRGQLELVLDGLALDIPLAQRRRASLCPLRAASAEQAPTTRSLRK